MLIRQTVYSSPLLSWCGLSQQPLPYLLHLHSLSLSSSQNVLRIVILNVNLTLSLQLFWFSWAQRINSEFLSSRTSHAYLMYAALVSLKPRSLNNDEIFLLLILFSLCLTPIHPARLNTHVFHILNIPIFNHAEVSLFALFFQWTFKFSLKRLIALHLNTGS